MDILYVINPLSPCTKVYTVRSQRGYLSGALSDNRTGRVSSEIFKLKKLLPLTNYILDFVQEKS